MFRYLANVWNDTTDYSKYEHIYLYAHQPHFYPFIFSNLNLLPKNIKIYLLDSKPGLSGYNGFNQTKELLIKNNLKIDSNNIIPIPFLYENQNMINTYNESLSVVKYFMNNNISKILLASPIFHIPRAFITFLSSSIELKYNMNIFCFQCGYICNRNKKKYIHSQGILEGTINELLEIELEKIILYNKEGYLINIDDALKYIDNRVL